MHFLAVMHISSKYVYTSEVIQHSYAPHNQHSGCNCWYAYPCQAKCVNLVKHNFLMADIFVVSLFETRKLWKLRLSQALIFDSALANSGHEKDGSTSFITHCNCPFMFKSELDMNHMIREKFVCNQF